MGLHLEVQLVRTPVLAVGLVCSVVSLCALPAGAQDKPRDEKPQAVVPSSSMPPAGQCRVWLRDVPAGQQPAPTDCATAIRKAPSTATILFGDLQNQPAQTRQSRTVAPGTSARIDDAPVRGRAQARRNFGPGAQGAPPVHSTRPPAGRNSTAGAPAPVIRPPAPPAPPPIKPPEKPQS